ncbi:hypothetical protein SERLADRAFT_369607 [Serpula lacrymans var. lacrymans S7.9]|uniref:Helitron helicase-like domain-containing protein n=1 Tax=Serpula lacrymans var. lacrymans (strain S7.9) TaxID=578457 RepID=F8NWG4_SERL9|nr:uncharacterized protein SERLADRAFT_369607 [Serpula lacrymans var. lacrymans S7.9]EGO24368.1 hypothetical protein SERLADRAFT_369607 [Serpula lacrymans var. lacrymans S7.9]
MNYARYIPRCLNKRYAIVQPHRSAGPHLHLLLWLTRLVKHDCGNRRTGEHEEDLLATCNEMEI